MGCSMLPSFMKRMSSRWPRFAVSASVAGKPLPLMVKPSSVSLSTIVYSLSNCGYVLLSFGSMMNAPSSPPPTCFMALMCEWYMCVPEFFATNS